MKLLIKAGANVLLKNRWGNMAVDDAKRVKATPVVELLEPLVTQVWTSAGMRGISQNRWSSWSHWCHRCEHMWKCEVMQYGQVRVSGRQYMP